VAFRSEGVDCAPSVEQGKWLQIYARWRANADASNVNIGIAIVDRTGQVLFARGWVNANLEPLNLRAGSEVVSLFSICLDMEPGDYSIMLTAADRAWASVAGHGVFGPRVRWRAMLDLLRDEGYPIEPPRRRMRDGVLSVPWDYVAPQ